MRENLAMNMQSVNKRKVVVVGAGDVGSTFAYALAQSGIADEIVLIDKNMDLVRGQVLDLVPGQLFFPTVLIRAGDSSDYTDARLIVLTAGASQNPGETRLQLLQKNASVVQAVAQEISARESSAVLLVVTNPVDVMTYVALEHTGWSRKRVMGSGTVLDTARFRHLLSAHCGIDVHNVHGYILGEHGDSEFAAWSMTHVAGTQIDQYCPVCGKCSNWLEERKHIEQKVRDSAYHIIDYKGATNFAVGLSLVTITGAVLRGQNSVLSVSTLLNGEFGLQNVCLSVPCVISTNGIEKIVASEINEHEHAALIESSSTLQYAIQQLDEDT